MTITQIVPMAGLAYNAVTATRYNFDLDLSRSPGLDVALADEVEALDRKHLSEYEPWDEVRKTL